MTTAQQRDAFTMIELLAVISVIAIALALTLPFIQSAREDARRTACVSNLKQIGLCLLNYEDKRKALPPISTSVDIVPDIPGDATVYVQEGDIKAPSPAAGLSWMV